MGQRPNKSWCRLNNSDTGGQLDTTNTTKLNTRTVSSIIIVEIISYFSPIEPNLHPQPILLAISIQTNSYHIIALAAIVAYVSSVPYMGLTSVIRYKPLKKQATDSKPATKNWSVSLKKIVPIQTIILKIWIK